MKLFIAVVIAMTAAMLCISAWCDDTATPSPVSFSLTDWSVGVAWRTETWDESTLVKFSPFIYKGGLLSVDLGLLDFEINNESDWWKGIDPIAGLSVDVIKLVELAPTLEPVLKLIPEAVGIGVGLHVEMEEPHDAGTMVYVILKL